MAASTGAPASAAARLLIASGMAERPASTASTTGYVASAERVLAVSDVGWKPGIGLVVLIGIAWAFGVLPVAVRLF